MPTYNNTDYGKAFEYAVLKAIQSSLYLMQPVSINATSSYGTAKNCYDEFPQSITGKLDKAANAAIRHIINLEPQLSQPMGNTPLFLVIQEDAKGQSGDVRDVLAIRKQNSWEIGISCKHNHHAVKHQRLSKTIDFGKDWLGYPCSSDYFQNITPVFDRLEVSRKHGELWQDMPDKITSVYAPILVAFMAELKRLADTNADVPAKLVQYLLGRTDFYKVISEEKDEVTIIQAFNINGTLNKQAGETKPRTRIGRLAMPTRIIEIDFLPGKENTVDVVCDHGWTIRMRIHNASRRVEPSLKFDVTLKGVPPELYTNHEPWDS